jgi:PEP-CTERM motif
VWWKNEGTTNPLPNDLIGGTIGHAHFDQRSSDFGQITGSGLGASTSAAIPEPSTSLLLIFAAAACWRLRLRRAA